MKNRKGKPYERIQEWMIRMTEDLLRNTQRNYVNPISHTLLHTNNIEHPTNTCTSVLSPSPKNLTPPQLPHPPLLSAPSYSPDGEGRRGGNESVSDGRAVMERVVLLATAWERFYVFGEKTQKSCRCYTWKIKSICQDCLCDGSNM